jgi:hypothetical protein
MKSILDQSIAGLTLIAFCCGLFAIGGGLVNVALDWLVPGYYPGVSHPAIEIYAGAYAFPLALGQGLLMGLVVGAVLAAGLGWLRQLDLAPMARALRLIAICGLLFVTIGAVLGYVVGTVNPNYYQTAFDASQQHRNFRPVDVGIGLGCTEGLVVGLFAGAVGAVGTAWHRSRRDRRTTTDFDQHPYDRPMATEPW